MQMDIESGVVASAVNSSLGGTDALMTNSASVATTKVTARRVVEAYLNFFNAQHRNVSILRPLLSENFKSSGPFGEFIGREAFLLDLKNDKLGIESLRILDLIAEGDRACVRYEVQSHDSAVGVVTVTEWFRVVNGQITQADAMFDASRLRALFAQI